MKKTIKVLKGLLWLVFSWIVLTFSGQALAQGDTWETKTPRNNPGAYAGAAVVGGILYVVGDNLYQDPYTVEAYDPEFDTWTFKERIPTPRSYPAVASINGKMYVAGGQSDISSPYYTNALEIYNPGTNTWETGPDKPGTAIGDLVGAAVGDVFYVIGGDYIGTAQSTLYAYDVSENTWYSKADMHFARKNHAATELNGKIYVVGGIDTCCERLDTMEVYDPAANEWTAHTMPFARAGSAAGAINGKLYVATGSDLWVSGDPTWYYTDELWEYDPVSDSWTELAPIPTERFAPVAGVIGGRLYVAGGLSDVELGTLEVYTPFSWPDAVTDTLQETIDTINGINVDLFKNKNMANALTNKIEATLMMVDQGDYQAAYDKLTHDIIGKMNGCTETEAVDKNDWIQDCEDQEQVYQLVMDVIDLLENLI